MTSWTRRICGSADSLTSFFNTTEFYKYWPEKRIYCVETTVSCSLKSLLCSLRSCCHGCYCQSNADMIRNISISLVAGLSYDTAWMEAVFLLSLLNISVLLHCSNHILALSLLSSTSVPSLVCLQCVMHTGPLHASLKSCFMSLLSAVDIMLPRMLFKLQETERMAI